MRKRFISESLYFMSFASFSPELFYSAQRLLPYCIFFLGLQKYGPPLIGLPWYSEPNPINPTLPNLTSRA